MFVTLPRPCISEVIIHLTHLQMPPCEIAALHTVRVAYWKDYQE